MDRLPPRTPSSLSETASTRSRTPARQPSSILGARFVTPRSSRPLTSAASRWSSPAGGISATERRLSGHRGFQVFMNALALSLDLFRRCSEVPEQRFSERERDFRLTRKHDIGAGFSKRGLLAN